MPKKTKNSDPAAHKRSGVDILATCEHCGSDLRSRRKEERVRGISVKAMRDPRPICRNRMCPKVGETQDGIKRTGDGQRVRDHEAVNTPRASAEYFRLVDRTRKGLKRLMGRHDKSGYKRAVAKTKAGV